MRLANLAGRDPNRLPYRVYTPLGEPVPVHFEPLTQADLPELNGPRWQTARYGPTWLAYVGKASAFKLILSGNPTSEIEGIVNIGELTSGSAALRKSVLEAAPLNQVQPAARYLSGVGRVLVARLIVASHQGGGDGSVVAYAMGDAQRFYTRIGFEPLKAANYFRLTATGADALLSLALD